MISRPLLSMVAESMVIRRPMTHVGCLSASATAIFANSSGPPPPGESKISVTALNSAGANLNGMYVSFWSNASVLPGCSSPCSSSQGLLFSCYSPCTAFVTNGAVYYVAVADYGGETFTHWSDGTPDRFYKLMVGNTSTVIGLSATFSP